MTDRTIPVLRAPKEIETYKGHSIVKRPYCKSGWTYEAKCPYGGHDVWGETSLRATREAIDKHLRSTYTLMSAYYNGLLPQCPGGA